MTDVVSLTKISVQKAAELCQDIELEQEALSCLESDPGPVAFLNALLAQKLYSDAVRFLARALPKREAVWWACISARSALGAEPDPKLLKAVESAEAWVYKPTETHRRQANSAAETAAFDNPAAWAAMGAFWSEGSMAPEEAPAVPPADNLTAKAVAGAVMLSCVLNEPEKSESKYQFFIEQGVDIANGGNGRLMQVQ